MRSALSLLLLAFALSPLPRLADAFDEIKLQMPDTGEIDGGEYYEAVSEAFCKGVGKTVSAHFGISTDDLRVECEGLSLTELKAKRLQLILRGSGVRLDKKRVEEYAKEFILPGGGVFVGYEI